ncbi:hypothetical protein M8R20_20990 [Pseudomonas sp. R2.Fl]|nr:hypothetical protein [Pseudomonas sp. R2.Fl]
MTNDPSASTSISNMTSACDPHKRVPAASLSKLRLTLVMVAFVYPIVTGLLYAMAPLTESWKVWHRTLVLTPATVTLIVFVVSPLVGKYFKRFVHNG